MSDFDLLAMEKVVAFIGEPDEEVRRELRQTLKQAGIKQVSAQGSLANLANLIGPVNPDIILLADDLDPKVFDFICDVRHNRIGGNPFVVFIVLVGSDHIEAVKAAMQSGADDIIVKPVKTEHLLQRLKRVMVNRSAFVVTGDYLGPDRRNKNRPSNIRRINVVNTMLEKATGQAPQEESIREAVDGAMTEVLQARLDSHSLRLAYVCNQILEAYKSKNVTPDTQDKLHGLVEVLGDAAKTAEKLAESQLAALCATLSADVSAIAGRYTTLSAKDLELIQKLSKAVVSTVKPKAAPDKLEADSQPAPDDAGLAPVRSGLNEPREIRRAQVEEPVVSMEEPVIEILPLSKGQFLFKQGDEATSAYILNSGAIGIFKEVDGKRQPIARVKKGEFFGEMAIIDGRPRRNSAMALEDCTLSLVSKEMIEEKLSGSDSLVRTLLHMLSNSLRMVHEAYAPTKGRNVTDAVREMKEQARYVQTQIETGSAERRRDGAAAAKKMVEITDAIVKAVESMPEAARRAPTERDLAD